MDDGAGVNVVTSSRSFHRPSATSAGWPRSAQRSSELVSTPLTRSTSNSRAGCRTTRCASVVDLGAMTDAVRWIQDKVWVDRLEATIEAHTLTAAQVRESCTIPITVRTAWLCRDKPSMKEALRAAGIPTAASRAAHNAAEVYEFANTVGFPLILKPRTGAGALDTTRWTARPISTPRSAVRRPRPTRSRLRSSSRATRASTTRSASTGTSPSTSSRTTSRTCSKRCALGGSRHSSSPPIAWTRLRTTGSCASWVLGSTKPWESGRAPPTWVVLRPEGTAVLRDRLPPARRGCLGPLFGWQRHGPLPRMGQRDRARPHRCPPVPKPRRRHRGAAAGPRRSHHRVLRCR